MKVINEILHDLKSNKPMLRLLQGDELLEFNRSTIIDLYKSFSKMNIHAIDSSHQVRKKYGYGRVFSVNEKTFRSILKDDNVPVFVLSFFSSPFSRIY